MLQYVYLNRLECLHAIRSFFISRLTDFTIEIGICVVVEVVVDIMDGWVEDNEHLWCALFSVDNLRQVDRMAFMYKVKKKYISKNKTNKRRKKAAKKQRQHHPHTKTTRVKFNFTKFGNDELLCSL